MLVAGIAGWSGAGKTMLITRLIPVLVERGCTVSTVKHAHHDLDMDQPGKDSWRHREAGATEVMAASDRRWFLQHEHRDEPAASLATLLNHLTPVDLVIVEGFKRSTLPKLEVFRPALGKPALYPEDPAVAGIAVVGGPIEGAPVRQLDVMDADDIPRIAGFLLEIARPLAGMPG